MALDLSTLTTEQQIAAIYIGYYERAGEPDGANFWEAVLENPAFSLADIASDFAVQTETLEAHPFFADPTEEAANAFLTSLYGNLFAREADVDGLNFWAPILVGVINGETFDSDGDGVDDITQVGDIILAIIQGAQDVDGGAQDRTAILNKIEVATSWTSAAEADGQTAPFAELGSAVQASASSIVAGVTAAEATVTSAKGEIDTIFAPEPVEGNTIFLTSATDRTDVPNQITGIAPESTDNDDLFLGYMAQNPFAGGVSNSLSSADVLDGKGGTDRLYAELSQEFVGATSNGTTIDVQPKLTSIETVELEARDMGFNSTDGSTTVDVDADADFDGFLDFLFDDILGPVSLSTTNSFTPVASFDGKDSFGINTIGSVNSDGDLLIENLNTKVNRDDAVGRKTADMTITMDHTDNFNSDGDASDLTVYFDENYLLANDPEQAGAQLTIELMDLDAETLGQDPLLDNPFGAITFTFGDELKELNYGTDSNTYAELLADIQTAIDLAAQTDPDFAQLTASFGPIFTVRDTDNDPNPARPPLDGTTIVITNSGPEVLEAVSMIATGTQPAGKDFHTGFDNEAPEEENFKIEVDIDLHKVGRGGEGGNLVVGGKDQDIGQGIHVFNVDVLGAGEDDPNGEPSKPSNLGTLTSTNGDLQTINIETHADFVDGDTFASLTIRDGFNHVGATGETGDLMMVNANDFLGDLTLGTGEAIINLDMLSALGGGDVTFRGVLDGNEEDQDYVYLTGAGEDAVSVTVDGDALDYANSSLEIKTGDNDDMINVDLAIMVDSASNNQNEQLNQAILDNVDIDGEAGNDVINVDGVGNANIDGSGGRDIIYTDGDSSETNSTTGAPQNAVWAFNFDNVRADVQGLGNIAPDELPGVETSLAYLDGARVTVTLSGAGTGAAEAADGGGVMALLAPGAVQGDDGYEKTVTITDLINGNEYYGDQRDVNAAVIRAIETDPVLNALLSATIEANNTLVIASKTSGDFDADDIRIDIQHGRADSSSYANAVLDEAREEFGNSELTLSDLWGGTNFSTAQTYETDGIPAPGAPGVLFANSAATNAWYDGLSVRGSTNAADDNLHTEGGASTDEVDNVINGGADNDIIVLSTDAVGVANFGTPFAPDYTDGGNNAMINGASNETIEMDGNFGNDTVMNFTTANIATVDSTAPVGPESIGSITDSDAGTPAVPERVALELDMTQLADRSAATVVTFDGVEITVPAGATEAAIQAQFLAEFGTASVSGYTAEAGTETPAPAAPDAGLTVLFYNDTIDLSTVTISELNEDITPSFVEFEPTVLTTPAEAAVPASFEVTITPKTIADVDAGEVITILGEEFAVADAATPASMEALIAAGTFTDWTASADDGDGVITFTYSGSDPVGTLPDFTDTAEFEFDIVGSEPVTVEGLAAGLDFLDFTSYLTSLEDESDNSGSGSTDSDVSDTMIPVTLDFDLLDIQANEVAVLQAGDAFNNTPAADSWAGLTASVLQSVINSSDASNDYGTLDASSANADDEYGQTATTDDLVGGAAKAVVMIENFDNLGEYKVFELSWNGDASNDSDSSNDGSVTVAAIGELDFGTTLTGLDDVNLVGSEEYNNLVENGILNYV